MNNSKTKPNKKASSGIKILSSLALILIALLWGGSFVAQSSGGNIIGPFSFGFLRFFIAGVAILPVALISGQKDKLKSSEGTEKTSGALIRGGIICGIFLAGTSLFQQLGMFMGTPSGKAGFLTSCYIFFVPLMSLVLFRKRPAVRIWLAVAMALTGLYLLCVKDGFSVALSDLLVLLCSVMIASRIHAVDKFTHRVNTTRLACAQFFVASATLGIMTAIFEINHGAGGFAQWWTMVNQWKVWGALLYSGVLAGTVAFTLQIIAQKNINPTIASLLMSLESVFSVLAGWIILGDKLSVRELLGCGIIFIALVIAQTGNKSAKQSDET